MKVRYMTVLSLVQKVFPPPRIMTFPSVGVDISDTSLKYVQFERKHSHDADLTLNSWGEIQIPAGVLERGSVHDIEQLGKVLAEVRKKTDVPYVRASLPEERAYIFETTIDSDTPAKEIRGLLEFRLEENVPLSPRDAYFDYMIVGRDKENHEYRVVVAVYAQETIDSYYQACLKAGFTPLAFEIEAQAIARASIPKDKKGTYMIVDFGKTRMGIGIVYNDTLMYTSTIEISGEKLSADMRKVIGDVAESELTKMKNTRGLMHTAENEKIAEVLEEHAGVMAEELAIRMRYWHSRGVDSDSRQIQKVLICGGSSNLLGLPEFLSRKLDTSVERAQVWTNVLDIETNVPPIMRRYSYGYATAIGLALNGIV
jgi:type IV pilus assembly protein PilM